MIRISVAFLPTEVQYSRNTILVALDSLRATSTVTTLADRGCERILPVSSDAEALLAKRHLENDLGFPNVLLCGEDLIGRVSEGFDLYNSPYLLSKMSFVNKIVIIKSTSGTELLSTFQDVRSFLVGSALNATACSKKALDEAERLGIDRITLVCAGSHGNKVVTMEDVACAGLLVDRMMTQTVTSLDDAATIALAYYQCLDRIGCEDLKCLFEKSDTGQRLISAGEKNDVLFCSQVDQTDVVPVKLGYIRSWVYFG
jgi:2-phosphosulfolactate phosphatase